MRSLAAVTVAILALRVGAEESPEAKRALDRAERAADSGMSGGQALAEFWDGFEAGTEIEFHLESTVKGEKQESAVFYRIEKRDGRKVSLRVKSGDFDKTLDLQGLPEGMEDGPDHLGEAPVDTSIKADETVKIGDKEYSCAVYERTVKTYPQCGTGEPRYRLMRIRAWQCSDVSAQGGVLKVAVTYEEDWGKGLEVRQKSDVLVTDLAAKRKVGDVEVDCYAVTIRSSSAGVDWLESTQLRTDTVPGGALESTEKMRDSEGKSDWIIYHHWVEKMTLVRKAEVEKPK